MFLKNPIALGVILVICLALQIWISYISALHILEGDFVFGLGLFLAVPVLGLLMVLFYFWCRRQQTPKPPGKDR